MRAWELEEIAAAEREANGLAPSSDSKSDSAAGLLRPVDEDEGSVLRPADDEAVVALNEQPTPVMPDAAEGEYGPVPDGDDAKVAAMDGTEWRTTWAIPGVTTEELDDTLEYLEAVRGGQVAVRLCTPHAGTCAVWFDRRHPWTPSAVFVTRRCWTRVGDSVCSVAAAIRSASTASVSGADESTLQRRPPVLVPSAV